MKSFTTGIVLFALLFSAGAVQANPCRSHFMKVSSQLRALGPVLGRLICEQVNRDDAAAVNECVSKYEEAKRRIEAIVGTYNNDAGSATIGPRGLGWGYNYKGTLLAERVFISPNSINTRGTLKFRVTGGKFAKRWNADVCVVDAAGNSVDHQTRSFSGSRATTWTVRVGDLLNKRVMVYLRKPVGAKGVKFNINLNVAGTPIFMRRNTRAARTATRPGTMKRPGR